MRSTRACIASCGSSRMRNVSAPTGTATRMRRARRRRTRESSAAHMPLGCVPRQTVTSSALITERHSHQFFLEALLFGGRFGAREPFRKLEELLLLAFARLESGLDQIHNHTICARVFTLRKTSDTTRDA